MIKNTEQPSYYSRFPIQPIDFISANKIDFLVGNVIKYVCRYDAKNGLEDLKKAKDYLEKLIGQREHQIQTPSSGRCYPETGVGMGGGIRHYRDQPQMASR